MPVDPRFYAPLGALTLRDIAELTGGSISGDPGIKIDGLGSSADARPGEITFIEGDGRAASPLSGNPSACFVNQTAADMVPDGVATLTVAFPRLALAQTAQRLFGPLDTSTSSHSISESAILGQGAVVGTGATIGAGTVIGPNTVIGPGVQIGKNCRIGANVSVHYALLGDHVTLLAGSRIGEAGFGVMAGPDGLEDAPHFGRVILQDHVTIGANSCVDRGVFGDTIIGERTKLDNQCQIAHNVIVGRNVVMAAFCGISGSVVIGDGCQLGGRAGIADHVKIGKGVSLAASAGLFRDIPDGETWGGTPAKPIRQWMRETAWLQKQTRAKKTSPS